MRKWRRYLGVWLNLPAIALVVFSPQFAGAAGNDEKTPKHTKRHAAEEFFASTNVPLLRLTISRESLNELRTTQWRNGARPSVKCTLQEGSTVYSNVALHLKGSAGSFQGIDQKPGLTLNMDKFAEGQAFHGLAKVSLNNSRQDATYITDKLCRELYEQLGVPVPRANYVRLNLNRRDLGLYVLTEGWDKTFLKRHFKNVKGNLYDGGFAKDITITKEANSGENPDDQSDLRALVAAARLKDLQKRLAAFQKSLDVDRLVTMMALDALTWNWDGYPLNHNNYRVYHDLDHDRMIFLPHGMDQMFWKPEGPLVPAMKGLVAKAAMQIPEVRQRYLDRAAELMNTALRPQALTNRVMELARRVRPILQTLNDREEADNYQSELNTLLARINGRMRSIDKQLSGVKGLLHFEGSEPIKIASWDLRNKSTQHVPGSRAQSRELELSPGSRVWGSTVWLVEGKYRLEGRVRTQKLIPLADSQGTARRETRVVNGIVQNYVTVANEPGGAGFLVWSERKQVEGNDWDWFPYRESRNYVTRGILPAAPGSGKRVSGDLDWTNISYDFELRQPVADLHIIFDLRASAGKALLDSDSVTIRKLN